MLPKGARIWSRGGLTEINAKYLDGGACRHICAMNTAPPMTCALLRPMPSDLAPPSPHKWTTKDGHLHENKRQRLPSLGGFISKTSGEHIPARYKVVYAPEDVKMFCYDWSEKPVKKSFVVAIVHVDELDAYLSENIRYDVCRPKNI